MSESTIDTEAAAAAGVTLEQQVPVNYWGFDESELRYFPDGVQYLEIKKLNEGERAKFQKATGSDVFINRATQEARLKADAAGERKALVTACVKGWKVFRDGREVPYSDRLFEEFYHKLDPRIAMKIEEACRKANPWLTAEMTSDDIRQEIKNLEEMLEAKLREEAGEASSSSR